MKKIIWILLFVLITSPAFAETLFGKVERVVDGDTIKVRIEGRLVTVRLAEIDAPERKQSFGPEAMLQLQRLVEAEEVSIEVQTTDMYGRYVGRVFSPPKNGLDICATMVRQGFAWTYQQYSRDRQLLYYETEARLEHLGLWAERNPVAPWDWRRSRKLGN